MAVQAQFYSDHYHRNNNMGLSNLPQDWALMDGSFGFGFGDEKKPFCSSYQRQQDQGVLDCANLVSSSNSRRNGMIGSQNLCSELERQSLEMNCFLHHENEKLKAVLNEETRKTEAILMQNYESKMKAVIDSKDEVLNAAKIRTNKLQKYLTMAEEGAKMWERRAIESEAMMTHLNRELNQAIAKRPEDAESICNGGDGDDRIEKQGKMVCKVCHVRSTCVLLLPCMHLCSCRPCEGLLITCPVCETVKNGSLDVFFGPN